MGNLPSELTSFVGRRQEVAELKRRLAGSQMVTLTGPGGVGKTRLALKVGATIRTFGDDVWLVELNHLRDPGLVAGALAEALGVLPAHSPMTALVEHLGRRQALLIFDNCEHLAEAVAALADELLRRCPHLRIVATSRRRLNAVGETTMAVSPLSLPAPSRSHSVQELRACEAIALFVERATAKIGFELCATNQAAVIDICRRLDGLPLAIELVTARLGALSVQEIAARLDNRFHLAAAGPHGLPERQQSLQACITWSYNLCTSQERLLWARLSIFPGVFDLDAVEGICTDNSLPDDQLLDALIGLVDKSILIADQHGTLVRYRLFETIREFGRNHLRESGEYQTLTRQHNHWYGDLIARMNAALGMGLVAWRQGEIHRAKDLLEKSLRLKRTDDLLGTGLCLEALAWIAARTSDAHRTAALLGAANTLQSAGTAAAVLPDLATAHISCERQARHRLGDQEFQQAFATGADLSTDDAVAYALDELPLPSAPASTGPPPALLTPRELQVAQLVAEGLTNKEIAARLVIAQRTAEGHIEHILVKLNFRNRAQIAIWATEQHGGN